VERRSERSAVNIWVRNTGKNEFHLWLDEETLSSDFSFCYATQDLSEYGVFLEADTPLPINSELDLELTLPGEAPIAAKARVKWVRDAEDAAREGFKPGMGLEFISLAPEKAAAIRHFLKSLEPAS
jgi:uncharacterized protein (TIGR02266 family)